MSSATSVPVSASNDTHGLRASARRPTFVRASRAVVKAPSGFVEGAFYVVVFYSIFGQNLVSVPLLGIGTLALLALMCVMTLSGRIVIILRALAWPFAFATLFVAVQLIVHGVSPLYADLRAFVTWVLGLVVVQCLSFRRGFLGRFAIAALGVGLCTIPFLTTGGAHRVSPGSALKGLDFLIPIHSGCGSGSVPSMVWSARSWRSTICIVRFGSSWLPAACTWSG